MAMKKAILITGAGTGIGRETALLFAEKGQDVILVGRRLDKLQEVAALIKTKTLVIKTDMKNSKDVQALAQKVKSEFPNLGFIVNNAALFIPKSLEKTSEQEWKDTFETNVIGPALLIKELVGHLKEGSVVINIASTAGLRPLEGMMAYSTSKAALIHLTQSLALTYAARKISFHVICPGVVDTPIHGARDSVNLKEMAALHPLNAVGEPIDVARAVYFLATESRWMTGVVLPVDGGISLT
jgi:meso-butanediol dehydrogenase/(S,S)-butanediol dehydrogenase/diacetyl reductase